MKTLNPEILKNVAGGDLSYNGFNFGASYGSHNPGTVNVGYHPTSGNGVGVDYGHYFGPNVNTVGVTVHGTQGNNSGYFGVNTNFGGGVPSNPGFNIGFTHKW